MSYINCHSFLTGKDVTYNLIGVKLKHKKRNQNYGTSTTGYNTTYCNTSPYQITSRYSDPEGVTKTLSIYGASGFINQSYDASGELESEYHNSNTGKNTVISSKVYDIDDLEVGETVEDLFKTDLIKVRLKVVKKLAKDYFTTGWSYVSFKNLDGGYDDRETKYIITNIILEYVLLSNNEVIGGVDYIYNQYNAFHPTKFSMNSELFNIIDFDPRYSAPITYNSRYGMWFSSNENSDLGILYDGHKSTEKHDYVGLTHSLLAAEGWWTYRNQYDYKQFKIINNDSTPLTNSQINYFNVNGDILYFRHKIQNDPTTFIQFNNAYTNGGILFTPTEQIQWIDNYMGEKGYKYKDPNGEYDSFMTNVFLQSPILMPVYNNMFIPLTNDIKEGSGPEPGGDTPADDPETDYTPDESDGEQEFPIPPSNIINGDPNAEQVNLFRSSYSNYLFERFFKANASDNDNAVSFIQDAANPSAFELWGATFKLLAGHPTASEIISRVYMLPFEYNEIRGTGSAGFAYTAPVYGPVGAVTMGAKTHSEDPSQTGAPELNHIHYYLQILNRFKIIDLGTVSIQRVFNNYLDYTETKYTLNLPYAAGKIELDPDYLFMNGLISGTVKLIGCIDFDTGELSITVQLNNQLYYQTTVNIAIDRLVSVNDNMATPLAISKAVMASAATAGGFSKMLSKKQPDRSKEYEEMRTAEIIKRQQNETAEIAKRTSIQEEASMRMLKARKEGGL